MKAEYFAMMHALKEALWLRVFFAVVSPHFLSRILFLFFPVIKLHVRFLILLLDQNTLIFGIIYSFTCSGIRMVLFLLLGYPLMKSLIFSTFKRHREVLALFLPLNISFLHPTRWGCLICHMTLS